MEIFIESGVFCLTSVSDKKQFSHFSHYAKRFVIDNFEVCINKQVVMDLVQTKTLLGKSTKLVVKSSYIQCEERLALSTTEYQCVYVNYKATIICFC